VTASINEMLPPKILRYFMRRLDFVTVCVNVWAVSREIIFVVVEVVCKA
jgi:hypothetical protein